MKKSIILFFISLLFSCNFCFASGTEDIRFENKADSSANDSAGTVTLDNPLGVENVPDLIGQVINAILGVVGSLALLMFVYGGLTWMTAAGNEEKIKKGRGILMWSTIGLVVIFTSYAVLKFIISVLQGS